MTHWTRKRPRPNKANSRTDGGRQGPARPPVPPAGLTVQNKAHLRRTGRGEGPQGRPGRHRWARACETKPICPAPTGKGDGWQRRKRYRRWERACETNPIPGVRRARWIWNRQLRVAKPLRGR
jgi:hypothetical protein